MGYLVSCRLNFAVVENPLELLFVEVGHPYAASQSLFDEFFHLLPRVEIINVTGFNVTCSITRKQLSVFL